MATPQKRQIPYKGVFPVESGKLAEINKEMEDYCIQWAEKNDIMGWKALLADVKIITTDNSEDYVQLLMQLCAGDSIMLEHKLWGCLRDAIRLYEYAAHFNVNKQDQALKVERLNHAVQIHRTKDYEWNYLVEVQNRAVWLEHYYAEREKYYDDYSYYYLQVTKLLFIELGML